MMDELMMNFKKVPKGYGEVAFYWWLGDKLTKERLSWQLEQLKDKAISGIQINYAHSDQGGLLWGLTFESDPPLFSEDWWALFGWYLNECKKYGISLSLSDYTLGSAGQGWFVDEMLDKYPTHLGQLLTYEQGVVSVKIMENTFNPIGLGVGEAFLEVFYKKFEERFPGECGKGLNFFFSDELNFGVRGHLWCDDFEEQFTLRKGYDLKPYLKGIFEDIGGQTAKIRLDYYDVIVALSEERFFKPVYQYHQDRQMTFGCDHGGRGKDVTEFGDYFRTMKWNQGPGNDQPNLESDVIKNKVSSSIAHLYERPRTWLEGFYGSGWGTSTAEVSDATFRNFAMGHNLLTLHGLYYSTHGGWWEWAPPCNHFRMPYWAHMGEFLSCSERLSYLLSQGVHVCDVAIIYPVAAMEGGVNGEAAVEVAFQTGKYFYAQGMDFDFIDFESIERAVIDGSGLKVAGECYQAIILPNMKTVRFDMMKKLLQWKEAGGTVICIGDTPQSSDYGVMFNAELGAINEMMFSNENSCFHAKDSESALQVVQQAFLRDFDYQKKDEIQPYILHRRVDEKDIYIVYGVPKEQVCTFRGTGHVELWNPWTAESHTLKPLKQTKHMTRLKMPLDANELHIIVFDSSSKVDSKPWTEWETVEQMELEGKWHFELKPTMDNRFGDFRLPATQEMIGAEVSFFNYQMGAGPVQKVRCGFGPRFYTMGPVTEESPIEISKLYEYSLRQGIEGDPGHQGYHGLKGEVSDGFLYMGKPEWTPTSTEYLPEIEGDVYYFWTTVFAQKDDTAVICTGEFKPICVLLNEEIIHGDEVYLKAGVNNLQLKYKGTGRTYFVLESKNDDDTWEQTYPLSMKWYQKPGVYAYDCMPGDAPLIGKYTFETPPALKSFQLTVRGELEVMVDDKKLAAAIAQSHEKEGITYTYHLDQTHSEKSHVTLNLLHERGVYGGAAIIEPVKLFCYEGEIELGDWSKNDGLYSYSGGAIYRKSLNLFQEQLNNRLILDLGDVVSSAEVWLNGVKVGVRVAPAWIFDLTQHAVVGENRIEVIVYNTLANHYTTIPTRYRGNLKSGLIGPVRLLIQKEIN